MTDELKQVADLITANIIHTTKAVLSSKEAAAYLGVSLSYLYKLTHRQLIPHSKPLGKLCFFDRRELEVWLMRNRIPTADELQDRALEFCLNKKGGNDDRK